MDLAEQIIAALRARNAAGETYVEMAKDSGISGAQIHRLANHRATPLKMSLQTFLSLFPHAHIELKKQSDGEIASELKKKIDELDHQKFELDKKNLSLERKCFELEKQISALVDEVRQLKGQQTTSTSLCSRKATHEEVS